MVKVAMKEPHITSPGYHITPGFISVEGTDLVRRRLAYPGELRHQASKRNTLQKRFFAEAARAWSALSPAERYVYTRMWRLPPPEHHSPQVGGKFLQGRDLFTADFIRAKKSGTPPPAHLTAYNLVCVGPTYLALPYARCVIYSPRKRAVVYNETSDIIGQLPIILIDPAWGGLQVAIYRDCFQTQVLLDYLFHGPDAVYRFRSYPDINHIVTYSDYCPTGLRGITRVWTQDANYGEPRPPGYPCGRGVLAAYRYLNSYTMEVRLYQCPGFDGGQIWTDSTIYDDGTYDFKVKLWDYDDFFVEIQPHLALTPNHKYAIVDYSAEPPAVIEYRDTPWEPA